MDLVDIFRAFHPNTAEYIFFSSAHGTFSRIDHMLRHKTSLNKFKIEKKKSAVWWDAGVRQLGIWRSPRFCCGAHIGEANRGRCWALS